MDNAPGARGGKVPHGMAHVKVFVAAAVFGLAAYAVVLGLVRWSNSAGLLEWLVR